MPQADGSIVPAVPITAETGTGNQVALDLGDGQFAFYAHLQPGVRVKLGERVRRGQVLGLVGNSGNATGPGLHFHIGDRNSLNGCLRGARALARALQAGAFRDPGEAPRAGAPAHGPGDSLSRREEVKPP